MTKPLPKDEPLESRVRGPLTLSRKIPIKPNTWPGLEAYGHYLGKTHTYKPKT
ncbi:hypothetical protein HOD38_03655 [archaeon]|jgi:hypothetical protein|nr:hypothetical protein [archaeon]MBT4397336.1 hypothetical protein [archaeon]MBT4440716.1 hypothetical protein [archaeon]